MPAWIQILSALLTPAIAIGVGVIGYWQWRTANRQWQTANAKLNLDLFEKRLAVYEEALKAVAAVIRTGMINHAADAHLLRAMSSARFLFGKDVRDLLEDMWKMFSEMRLRQSEWESTNETKRIAAIERHGELLLKVTDFQSTASKIFDGYMGMDHRLK